MENNQAVPKVSAGRPVHPVDTLGTPTRAVANQLVGNPFRTAGTAGTPSTAGRCRGQFGDWHCNAELNPHNITGWCAECKLIARNERMTGIPADPAGFVTVEQALANLAAVIAP